jgi:adenylosuccinate synthase
MKKIDVVIGLQWGDEGKGKIIDCLAPNYDVIARFQGGPNAGHTIEFEGKKYVLRSIPSGIFQEGVINVIGNGVVIDPVLFREEAENLMSSGYHVKDRLFISNKAHLIMPTHCTLDVVFESMKGGSKIGTTGKGIGPTYADKINRNGLRVGDLFHGFEKKYREMKAYHEKVLKGCCGSVLDLLRPPGSDRELERKWFEAVEFLKTFQIIDTEHFINDCLVSGKSILAEGAQGTMLDIDFGSYPYVTSSNTIVAGCCSGLGVAPHHIGKVYGVFKAYCTRVGEGPFPTELHDEVGELLCERGHEFGSVTGRKRRCGWIDLVALRYAIMINGVTDLILMKCDVLDTLDEIKVCIAYKVNGMETTGLPFYLDGQSVEPVYRSLPGWKVDLTTIHAEEKDEDGQQCFSNLRDYMDFHSLPEQLWEYISVLENGLGVEIIDFSYGPDRDQVVALDSESPFW